MNSSLPMFATAAVALATALGNALAAVRSSRKAPSRRCDAAWWLPIGAIGLSGIGYLLQTPWVYHQVDRVFGVNNIAAMINGDVFIGCACLAHLWAGSWPGARVQRLMWVAWAYAAATVLLDVLFLAAEHTVEFPGSFFTMALNDPGSTVYAEIQLLVTGAAWAVISRQCRAARRAAWATRKFSTAYGVGAVQIGMYFSVACVALFSAALLLSSAAGDKALDPGLSAAAGLCAMLSVALCCGGLTCRVWGPWFDETFEAVRGARDYRLLLPLWRLVGEHRQLSPAPEGLYLTVSQYSRKADYLHVRIWDASHELARYLDAAVADRTRRVALAAGHGERRVDAEVAMALLRDAVERRRSDRRPQQPFPLAQLAVCEPAVDYDPVLAVAKLVRAAQRRARLAAAMRHLITAASGLSCLPGPVGLPSGFFTLTVPHAADPRGIP